MYDFFQANAEGDPLVFVTIPRIHGRNILQQSFKSDLITIGSSGALGLHIWTPYDRVSPKNMTFERDPTLVNSRWVGVFWLRGLLTNVVDRYSRNIAGPFHPSLHINSNMFAVTPDCKLLFYGGNWDNSLRVYNFAKGKTTAQVIRHRGKLMWSWFHTVKRKWGSTALWGPTLRVVHTLPARLAQSFPLHVKWTMFSLEFWRIIGGLVLKRYLRTFEFFTEHNNHVCGVFKADVHELLLCHAVMALMFSVHWKTVSRELLPVLGGSAEADKNQVLLRMKTEPKTEGCYRRLIHIYVKSVQTRYSIIQTRYSNNQEHHTVVLLTTVVPPLFFLQCFDQIYCTARMHCASKLVDLHTFFSVSSGAIFGTEWK